MDSRVFDVDPLGGSVTNYHYDDVSDGFYLETVQDVTPIIEANKRAQNAAPERFEGDVVRIASIPLTVYMDLQQRGITRDPKAFSKWLNDPDNSVFRTRSGRV